MSEEKSNIGVVVLIPLGGQLLKGLVCNEYMANTSNHKVLVSLSENSKEKIWVPVKNLRK